MNIINNIKKYFKTKNDTEKTVMTFTSADNVLDKESGFYVDEKLDALNSYCNTLSNFVEPMFYRMENTDDLNFATDFSIVVIGKVVIGTGLIYTRSAGAGLTNATVNLPLKLRPKNSRVEFSNQVRIETTNYNLNVKITKANPDKMTLQVNLGSGTIPAGKTIPLNFCYVLDNNVVS